MHVAVLPSVSVPGLDSGLDTLLDLIVGPRGTGVADPCGEGASVCEIGRAHV